MNSPGQAASTRIVLLTVVIVVAVLRLAQEVFVPLALAILFTFLLAPLVGRLHQWGVNRLLAVAVSVAFALTLIGALADVAFNQLSDLAHELPGYQRQLHENLTHIRGALRGGVADASKAIEQLGREIERVAPSQAMSGDVRKVQLVEPTETPLQVLRDMIGPLVRPFGTALVVIVLVAFMLLRLGDLRERLIRVLGGRNLYATTEALSDAGRRVSRYLLMQLLINTWTGVVVGLGLWALNVPNPGLWGTLALVLRFVPYVGIWSAAAIPFLLSFAVTDDLTRPVLVLALFGVLELFNYAVLEPWLYANHTGISPVALLLSAAFWTWLWGPVGLLLAIPMTVCVSVMSKYIPQLEFLRVLMGDEPVIEPHQRLYQRLLAGNSDTADRLLDETLRACGSTLKAADAVIVPAIRLMESDYDRRTLGASKRRLVLEHVNQWVEERLELVDRADSAGKMRRGARVLCVPAADRAGEVVARLLTATLLEAGVSARFVKPDALEHIALGDGEEGGSAVDVIIVSALPPEAVHSARTVCRSVRSRTRDLPLMVGLWDPDRDLTKPRQRLQAAGAGSLAVTFAECLSTLDAMAATVNGPAAGAPQAEPSLAAAQAGASSAEASPSSRRGALLHS
jgi:predicted PurR-regulated permease PerM